MQANRPDDIIGVSREVMIYESTKLTNVCANHLEIRKMRLNNRYLAHQLSTRFFSKSDFFSGAVQSWEVRPKSEAVCKPAFFNRSDLSRIRGIQSETTEDMEQRRINGGKIEHDATQIWEFANATVSGGDIYNLAGRYKLNPSRTKIFVSHPISVTDDVALAVSPLGNRYFAHSIIDDFALQLLAEQHGTPIRTTRELWSHQRELQSRLGLEATCYENARLRRLYVFEDRGQHQHKAARYNTLRARIRKKYSSSNIAGAMILRGSSGAKRILNNEFEIAEYLCCQGFRVVDPETMTADEICHHIMDAPIVLGVEGSHLAHGFYTVREHGAILVLQPPSRFNNLFKDYADAIGLRYGFTVGIDRQTGFDIPLDSVKRLVEMSQKLSP